MKLKTILWILVCIAAPFLLLIVGIKLFDGRSPKAIIVHKVLGFRALNSAKYDFDREDTTDKSTVSIPEGRKARAEISGMLMNPSV